MGSQIRTVKLRAEGENDANRMLTDLLSVSVICDK